MIEIKRYTQEDKRIWNYFNTNAKNSLFMFNRDYMDYHSDRFQDHSLIFFKNDSLIALLPMSERGGKLISHGGLTYGGFITDGNMKQKTMNECFEKLVNYAKNNNFDEITYKTIPHVFHTQPAEEDRYSLFINHADFIKIEASTAISLENPLKMSKGRKAQISRAKREGCQILELTDKNSFQKFIELENEVLNKRHNTKAVHSYEEIYSLYTQFPDNIHLYVAVKDAKIIAGTIIFEYNKVIHTQYMAADDTARKIGALDLVISTIINKYKENKEWLDFGISTEKQGYFLNEGLISQKESFGGRTIIYETWKLNISNDI